MNELTVVALADDGTTCAVVTDVLVLGFADGCTRPWPGATGIGAAGTSSASGGARSRPGAAARKAPRGPGARAARRAAEGVTS